MRLNPKVVTLLEKDYTYREDIEMKIIAACVGENLYRKVTFLRPSDFIMGDNSKVFKIVQECNGDLRRLIKSTLDVEAYSTLVVTTHIEQFGLMLIEDSIKSEISSVLFDCATTAKDIEINFLMKLSEEAKKRDALLMCNNLVDYIAPFVSDKITSRVKRVVDKWNNRIHNVVEEINGQ